jgi:hypothetical protein
MSLRQDGVAYATIQVLIAPVFTFYQLNDVILNRKKVHRYLGEYKRIVRDKAYSTEQIQQALQNADQRMRCIILLLASTACRLGSLPALVFRNLTKLPAYGLYKVTFYEGTSNEYYTFTTRECAQTGIENYLLYRQRSGEKISFNQNTNRWEPEDTPLIRQQFDVNDILQVRRPKPMTIHALRFTLALHLVKSGLREVEHPPLNTTSGIEIGFSIDPEVYRCLQDPSCISRSHIPQSLVPCLQNPECFRTLTLDTSTGLTTQINLTKKELIPKYNVSEPGGKQVQEPSLNAFNQTLNANNNTISTTSQITVLSKDNLTKR